MNNIKHYYILIFIFILVVVEKSYSQIIDTTFEGVKVVYYQNGFAKSKIEYKNGKPNGLAQIFDDEGRLIESGYFINNKWVGNYVQYYQNGRVMHNFNFDKNGKRIGLQKYYHSNGIIAIIGFFIDGNRNGCSLEYDEKGNLINKPQWYENDIEISFPNPMRHITTSFANDAVSIKNEEKNDTSPLVKPLLEYVKNENENVFKILKLKQTEDALNLKQKENLISLLEVQKKSQEIFGLNKDKEIKEIALKNSQLENEKRNEELETQKKEATLKNTQLKHEKKQRWFLYGGLALVLLFASFMYNRFKITHKQKLIIETKEKETKHQNIIISQQKHLVEEKQKEITDSINYAQRLQHAILPPIEFITKNFIDSFILYKPKDIVAGDFYWAEQINDLFFIAAADCTGHGVPGAMVSVVCSNALNRSVKEFALTDTGKILEKTRELVIETFEKSSAEIKDGMDISLFCIDKKNQKLYWSGANNALWYVQNNTLTEIKADKQPVGKSYDTKPFTTHHIEYKTDTSFYLFTDGFADQFGGPKGKKFKYKQFEETLVLINHQPMKEQAKIIDKKFDDWKGTLEQVDDVCVIGIKI